MFELYSVAEMMVAPLQLTTARPQQMVATANPGSISAEPRPRMERWWFSLSSESGFRIGINGIMMMITMITLVIMIIYYYPIIFIYLYTIIDYHYCPIIVLIVDIYGGR